MIGRLLKVEAQEGNHSGSDDGHIKTLLPTVGYELATFTGYEIYLINSPNC